MLLPRSLASRSLCAVAALLVVAACGGTSDDAASGESDAGSGTSLRIFVTTDEGAEPATYRLTCDPAGGDHPQSEQACDVLDEVGATAFDPVPADTACTELYGGPQVAKVTGTYEGKKVDATFNRTNGCETDRWDALGTTFFNVPLL
ncbi:SSI family serine proteinase inhibitor [Aeromicrobium sp. UC242_57]